MSTKTLFNESWLEEEKYKQLLEKYSNDKNSFRCHFCCSKISLSYIGKRELESHMQKIRHKQKRPVKSGCIFETMFDANVNTSEIESKLVNISTLTMRNFEIIATEIYWAFKVVQSNLSLNSCNDSNSLLWKMLPDSDILRSYSMAKTKVSYEINVSIATHFRVLLLEKLVESKFCSVCLDESFNKVVQKYQMDFSLRLWNKTPNEAVAQDFSLSLWNKTPNEAVAQFRFKFSRSCVCSGFA